MGGVVTITGDDVVMFHGNSISTDPRAWFNATGSFLDRMAAASPGPRGGPYKLGSCTGAKSIVTGNVGFQRGSKKTTMPPWTRVSGSGQSILALPPQQVIPYNPDVILHESQANDEMQGPNGTGQITLLQYETGMRNYIDTLTAWKPSIRIIWIGIWSLEESYVLPLAWHTHTTTFKAIDQQVISEKPNVVYADIEAYHLLLLQSIQGPFPVVATPFTDDGVHPSDPVGKNAYCDGVMPYVRFRQ